MKRKILKKFKRRHRMFLYFRNPEERKQILEFTESAVKYVHDNKIQVVVSGGTSAQPLLYLFKAIWKKRYPEEKIYFFTLPAVHIRVQTPEKIKQLIEQRRKKLADMLKSNGPVFVLEEMVATGQTIKKIRAAFNLFGVKKVKVGCMVFPGVTSPIGRKIAMDAVGIDLLGEFSYYPIFYRQRVECCLLYTSPSPRD